MNINKIAHNSVWNLAGQAIPLIAALLAIPVLINELDEKRFGILALCWLITTYFSLFDFGIGRSSIRMFASSKPELFSRNIFKTSLPLHCTFGVLSCLFFISIINWLIDDIFKIASISHLETKSALIFLSISVPALIISSDLRAVLEAEQRFDILNLIRLPSNIANYTAPLFTLSITGQLDYLILSIVVTRWLVLFALAASIRYLKTKISKGNFKTEIASRLIYDGGWMSVSTLILPVILAVDRFVIASHGYRWWIITTLDYDFKIQSP